MPRYGIPDSRDPDSDNDGKYDFLDLDSDADGILGALPPRTPDDRAEGNRAVRRGIRIDFGLAVGLHAAKEHADVIVYTLLDAHAGTEFRDSHVLFV